MLGGPADPGVQADVAFLAHLPEHLDAVDFKQLSTHSTDKPEAPNVTGLAGFCDPLKHRCIESYLVMKSKGGWQGVRAQWQLATELLPLNVRMERNSMQF